MEIKHFYTLPVGATFIVDGEGFKKISDLTYRGTDGLERNIDPITDAKIGKSLGVAEAVPEAVPTIKLQGVIRDGNLVVGLRAAATTVNLLEGAEATVDGHFDGNVFVVTGISGRR